MEPVDIALGTSFLAVVATFVASIATIVTTFVRAAREARRARRRGGRVIYAAFGDGRAGTGQRDSAAG